jgi:hypothetical protein
MAIPTETYSNGTSSAGTISGPGIFPEAGKWEAGDILFVFIACATAQALPTTTGASPKNIAASDSGYTQMAGSPKEVAGGSRLYGFWRRLQAGDTTAQTGDSGEYQAAICINVRGALASGTPFEALAFGTETTSDTSLSIPSITTLGADRLILGACTTGADSKESQFTWAANAKLASPAVTEFADVCSKEGGGGGVSGYLGGKATEGETGATTATLAEASPKAFLHLAVIPAASEPQNYTKEFPETVAFASALSNQAAKPLADSTSLADSSLRAAAKTQTESVGLAEALTRAETKTLPETVALAEVIAKATTKPLADTAGLADEAKAARQLLRELADTVGLADALAKGIGAVHPESLALTDLLAKSIVAPHADSAALQDASQRLVLRAVTDAVELADASQRAIGLGAADPLALADAAALRFAAIRAFADSLALADQSTRTAGKGLAETIPTADQFDRIWLAKLALADTLGLADLASPTLTNAGLRSIAESLELGDSLKLALVLGVPPESLAISDTLRRSVGLGQAESTPLLDDLTRAWNAELLVAEEAELLDAALAEILPSGPQVFHQLVEDGMGVSDAVAFIYILAGVGRTGQLQVGRTGGFAGEDTGDPPQRTSGHLTGATSGAPAGGRSRE